MELSKVSDSSSTILKLSLSKSFENTCVPLENKSCGLIPETKVIGRFIAERFLFTGMICKCLGNKIGIGISVHFFFISFNLLVMIKTI